MSRDPLGLQPIWVRIGRQSIGNLTTVSNSVRGFTTLLLGLYFAERVLEEDRSASTLEVFLRWEQLVAYARGAAAGDFDFRGTERVQARLSQGREVTLSAEGLPGARLTLSPNPVRLDPGEAREIMFEVAAAPFPGARDVNHFRIVARAAPANEQERFEQTFLMPPERTQ